MEAKDLVDIVVPEELREAARLAASEECLFFCCTDQYGRPCNGGEREDAPILPVGEWATPVRDPIICERGYHATSDPVRWRGCCLWLCEVAAVHDCQGDKVVSVSRRFLGQVAPRQVKEDIRLWVASARPYLSDADLRQADLHGANLAGANLARTDLAEANLTGADLRGADLGRANLRGAYLRGADLRGADLGGANLSGVNLCGAYLRGACLRGAYLRGACLRGAYLRGADLRGADLRGADLRGADLRGAYLSGAYLSGADLSGADLRGADLHGASLGNAIGLAEQEAEWLGDYVLPAVGDAGRLLCPKCRTPLVGTVESVHDAMLYDHGTGVRHIVTRLHSSRLVEAHCPNPDCRWRRREEDGPTYLYPHS